MSDTVQGRPDPSGPEIPSGTLFDNRYLIQKVLGHGGLGRTYLALNTQRFNEPCVLKEFSPRVAGEYRLKKSRVLFKREAELLYRIEHPQIPKFFASFERAGRLFLVQEFVNGRTYLDLLEERHQQNRVFSESEVIDWLTKLLPVLDYIHQLGIIHRDISPDNIMLPADSDLPVLIDFGVSKQVAEELAQVENSSKPFNSAKKLSIVGKIGYSPHEQVRQGICTPSSDLYALGVVAIVLLTVKNPSLLINQHTLEWEWHAFAKVSSEFAQILDKLVAKTPTQRYQSAAEVMHVLKSFLLTTQGQTSPPVTARRGVLKHSLVTGPASTGIEHPPAQAIEAFVGEFNRGSGADESYPAVKIPTWAEQSEPQLAAAAAPDPVSVTPQPSKSYFLSAIQQLCHRARQPVFAVGITLAIMTVAISTSRYYFFSDYSIPWPAWLSKTQSKPDLFFLNKTLSSHEGAVWSAQILHQC